jgi:glycerol-1-phosphatase
VTSLADLHDALFFDLDGTVFRGTTAIPGAPEVVAAVRSAHPIVFLTNNGSRNPGQVAEHLGALGFGANPQDVVTSGQAATRMVADRLPAGSPVLVVGTEALAGEVVDAGLAVTDRGQDARAVVQGHSADTGWRLLAEACLAIRAGALWVACNLDATLPDERGELPGNGAMVAALAVATGAHPLVAGKPEVALFEEAVRRTGARRALMVGDRLGTDIAGANAAGLASLLVLTGVSGPAGVLTAPEPHRPGYLGANLAALRADADRLRVSVQPPWRAQRDGADLVLALEQGASVDGHDPVAALRTLCAVHWSSGGGPARVRADGGAAARALTALRLTDALGAGPTDLSASVGER